MSSSSFNDSRTLGNQKFKSANYGAALMHYTDCINQNPQAYALYCNRAAALIKLDSIEEAKQDLKRSLEINSSYIPSLCRLAFVLLYEGNTIEALENYVRAVLVCSRERAQLERFKSQLKEAIRLTENRARQQGYSQEYIDNIIPDNVRILLDSYRSLDRQNTGVSSTVVTGGSEPVTNTATTRVGITGVSIPVLRRISTRPRNNNDSNNEENVTGSLDSNNSFSFSFAGPDGVTGDLSNLFSNMFGGSVVEAQTNNTNGTQNRARPQPSGTTDQDAMDTTPDMGSGTSTTANPIINTASSNSNSATSTSTNVNPNFNNSNLNNTQQQNFQQIVMDRMRQAAQTYMTQQQEQSRDGQNSHFDALSLARNIVEAASGSFNGGAGNVQSVQVEVSGNTNADRNDTTSNDNSTNGINSNNSTAPNISPNLQRIPSALFLSAGQGGLNLGNAISGFVNHIANSNDNASSDNTASSSVSNGNSNSNNNGFSTSTGNGNSTDSIPDDLDLD